MKMVMLVENALRILSAPTRVELVRNLQASAFISSSVSLNAAIPTNINPISEPSWNAIQNIAHTYPQTRPK